MTSLPYTYKATVIRVIDGDTMIVDVDLGFYVTVRMSCRLYFINTRELSEPGGTEARDALQRLCPVGSTVIVSSIKSDKFAGRFDASVLNDKEVHVNTRLIDEGYAVTWNGKGAKPVPAWPLT